ncbi:MAG: exopolysaccharide biosynthesis protein, partial [Pseudomonadota bacterium]
GQATGGPAATERLATEILATVPLAADRAAIAPRTVDQVAADRAAADLVVADLVAGAALVLPGAHHDRLIFDQTDQMLDKSPSQKPEDRARQSEDGPVNLSALLKTVAGAGDGDRVSVADILKAVGTRSFGALLLVPSLIVISPISGIPGVPTTAALIIILICGQYLIGRRTIWLPGFLLRRDVSRSRLEKAINAVTPAARFLERFVRPRLTFLIGRVTFAAVALICALLAATMPPLELLPFTATATASIIALFAMALLMRDGALALISLVMAAAAVGAFLVWILPGLSSAAA